MKLHKDIIDKIYKHALEEYPYECCGIITGNSDKQTVHMCINIQGRLHAEDPARYPGDARIAYTIDRKELNGIFSTSKKQGEGIVAFYHSHPEHEAYFSEEDVAAQTVFGEPEFPGACHIVISVMNRTINDIKCFKWDGNVQSFRVVEDCPG